MVDGVGLVIAFDGRWKKGGWVELSDSMAKREAPAGLVLGCPLVVAAAVWHMTLHHVKKRGSARLVWLRLLRRDGRVPISMQPRRAVERWRPRSARHDAFDFVARARSHGVVLDARCGHGDDVFDAHTAKTPEFGLEPQV